MSRRRADIDPKLLKKAAVFVERDLAIMTGLELLEKYRDDERMMTVSGSNFRFGRRRTQDSYYFSRSPHIWGWATWRRAWHHYDGEMRLWPTVREAGWLGDILVVFLQLRDIRQRRLHA